MKTKSKSTKQKFTGSELKLQKHATKNVANFEYNRHKEILGESLYRDVVHFARFTGKFEQSLVFKRIRDDRERGTFIEFSEDKIPAEARYYFDRVFIVAILETYRLFEEAALSFDLKGVDDVAVFPLRRIELFQKKLKSVLEM